MFLLVHLTVWWTWRSSCIPTCCRRSWLLPGAACSVRGSTWWQLEGQLTGVTTGAAKFTLYRLPDSRWWCWSSASPWCNSPLRLAGRLTPVPGGWWRRRSEGKEKLTSVALAGDQPQEQIEAGAAYSQSNGQSFGTPRSQTIVVQVHVGGLQVAEEGLDGDGLGVVAGLQVELCPVQGRWIVVWRGRRRPELIEVENKWVNSSSLYLLSGSRSVSHSERISAGLTSSTTWCSCSSGGSGSAVWVASSPSMTTTCEWHRGLDDN